MVHLPINIIIIVINPLTAMVVGAPQMILQPVFSIFPCSPLLSGTCRTPGLSIPWCCLLTSYSVCLVLFPLSLCLARWFWPYLMNGRHDHTTAVWVSLQWSGGLRVVRLPAGSWHGLPRWQHGLCMRFVISCDSTSFLSLVFFFGALLWGSMVHKHTGRWMWQGSALVVSWNWEKYSCHFKLVSTLSMLLLSVLSWRVSRPWNPINYNWAQVPEACDSLKLLSIHFDLGVDATGVLCYQLSLLGTDLHAVGCGGFVEKLKSFRQFFFLSC